MRLANQRLADGIPDSPQPIFHVLAQGSTRNHRCTHHVLLPSLLGRRGTQKRPTVERYSKSVRAAGGREQVSVGAATDWRSARWLARDGMV